MTITFLIGNGFDANLNLKTKYTEFYPFYLKQHPNSKIAKNIMQKHNDKSEDPWEYWADLELGLGEYLANINTDEEVESFLDEKAELEACLSDYLAIENKKINGDMYQKISEEFKKKILSMSSILTEVDSAHYNSNLFVHDDLFYSFITFNYTNILDVITESFSSSVNTRKYSNNSEFRDYIKKPLHIHGDLKDNSLILGLNDASQINNEKLRTNRALMEYLIKENVNRLSGSLRMDKCIELINSSRYICLYGLSIGQTDLIWWKKIVEWLKGDSKRRLIYCVYKNPPEIVSSQTQKNRLSDKYRYEYLYKSQVNDSEREKLRKQIIILYNTDLFTYSVKAPEPQKDENKEEKELLKNVQT